MWRGLLKLTWLEIKIFMREPLGALGTILIPVAIFVGFGRLVGARGLSSAARAGDIARVDVPVFAAMMIAISAVLSLVTIVSIYREGGILKRLRATPLRPQTILSAHVLVKLLLSVATVLLMVLAGKRYYPLKVDVPVFSFTIALLLSTASILAIGFVIASIVPTARFAQPLGGAILYPMLGLSGLFVPLAMMPPSLRAVARVLPLTYAVNALRDVMLKGADLTWPTLQLDVGVAVSAKVFRWE